MHPFHLAFPVSSLESAREFYGALLGCPEGRSSDTWIDFNLYGHQIVAHLAPDEVGHRRTSAVDGDEVPVRHFGVVLSMQEWETLARRLREQGVRFIIEPHIRFKGEATDVLSFPGEGGEAGLGDVVIIVETAERNARGHGRTLGQELDVLALHGFLHLLGHDHETDDGEMDRLEARLRERLLVRP